MPDADERDRQRAREQRQPEARGLPHHRQPDVAPEHEVGAVGEVHDAHDPEDEREPAGEQEQESAVGDAVEGLRDPELCRHRPAILLWLGAAPGAAGPSALRAGGDMPYSARSFPRRSAVKLPPERFDYSPIAAAAPGQLPAGRPDRRVDHRQRGGVGHPEADGPPVLSRAAGRLRPCPTCPTGRGTTTGCASASGGCWTRCEAKLRATTSINAYVCESYEPVARAMLDAGWEFMGHGVVQGAMHLLPDQRAAIRESDRRSSRSSPDEAQGLAGSRPHRDVGDAGLPRRGGHRVRLGLGQRRPALRDPRTAPVRSCRCPTRWS